MKSVVSFALLFALFLFGSGCAQAPSKQSVSPQATSTSGATLAQQLFPTYKDLFQREAQPEWHTVSFDHVSLSIPFSSAWKFSDIGLAVFEEEGFKPGVSLIRFGRPADVGTAAIREYFFYRETQENSWEPHSLERLRLDLGCVDGYASTILKIGAIQGVLHHMGGAKGCSTGFAFHRGAYTYYLYRIPDIGQAAPELDEEMKRIIQSIH